MAYYDQIYGIGKGDAQVLQGNAGITALRQQYAQDQTRRAADDKELSAELAKVNYDGVGAADTDYFIQKYADISKLSKSISSLPRNQQAGAINELQGQKRLFSSQVANAKTENQTQGEIGKDMAANPDKYSDEAPDLFKKMRGTSTLAPEYHTNTENFASKAHATNFDMNGFTDKVEKNSLKRVTNPIVKEAVPGGGHHYFQESGQLLDKQAYLNNFHTEVLGNNAARRAIDKITKDKYPEVTDAAERADLFANEQFETNKGRYALEKKNVSVKEPEHMTEYERQMLGLAKRRLDDKEGNSYVPDPPKDKDIIMGDAPTDGKPALTTNVKGYVPITASGKNFAGSTKAISLKTGKLKKNLNSSDKYSIVGVGNVQLVDEPKMKQNGSLAQSGFKGKTKLAPMVHVAYRDGKGYDDDDYFIPFDDLQANVKNSKAIKEALRGFTPATSMPAKTEQKQHASKPIKIIQGF